ncbi:hypothetical protein DHEL01_v201322 [Diaporthe helianthi]|uniref:Uncharacterized protein n=1 Tax=Diaporthe helianthi TaxID=158607 RepID=A0A2P5ICP2_DIAHE|nr:hypothetical protein DHEL01_v201322 [Diaporthe helianthi]
MREEPLPEVLRSRRQSPDGLETTDRPATLMPDYPYPNLRARLIVPNFEGTGHLYLAALEFRRQLRLRQLQRQREKLVFAAMGLPLLAMLLKLLWSSFSGSSWLANEAHAAPSQGFVGRDW